MRLLVAGAALAVLVGLVGSAAASFPGRNGLIVVSSNRSTLASGEVYSIRPDGTGQLDLSGNPAADVDPVWSSDGSHIAFSRDGTIVVMDADGSGQLTLGRGAEPAWSPDGRHLAFIRDGALWASTATGTGEQQLTSGDPKDSWPLWSPVGGQIAYLAAGGQVDSLTQSAYLELIPSGGGTALELARGVTEGPSEFVWARDGGSLLYGNAYTLYRVAADAASDRVVLRAPATIGSLALSPGGGTLAFSVAPYGPSGSAGAWTVDLAGGTARQLTRSGQERDSLLTWSPAGDEIAFARSNDVRIHVIGAAGGAVRTLPREHPGTQFGALEWSPAHGQLLFATTFSGDTNLYSLTLFGSGSGPLRQLTYDWFEDVDPAWSPNGKTIAFASDRSGNYEIYTMGANGTGVRRLTHDPAADRWPTWSPDGSRIVFSSERLVGAKERNAKKNGHKIAHLYVMRSDGSHPRRLTRGATAYDQTPAWSPGGRLIMFSSWTSDPPNLETIRPDGTRRRTLGEGGSAPDWSPNGKLVAYLHIYYPDGFLGLRPTNPPPQQELALMKPDGEQVASLPSALEARWSPDGKLLATAGGAVLDRNGSQVATIPAGVSSWQPLRARSADVRVSK